LTEKINEYRRSIGLDNKATLGILDVVLYTMVKENRYPSKKELADGISDHYKQSGKLSGEYKQIKKLLPVEKKTSSRFRFTTHGFLQTKKSGEVAPTFRGLLLFLYLCKKYRLKKRRVEDYNYKNKPGRIRTADDKKSSTTGVRKHIQTIREIQRIFDKPTIQERAPFLKYWRDFERCGFKAVELSLEIAGELYTQLHIDAEHDKYLLRRASERYFVGVENYCYDDAFYFLADKLTPDELNLLTQTRHKYRRHMIPLLKGWIQKQQELFDYIDDKRKEDDIAFDTSFDDDKIILFSDLASKYGTNIARVSKALGLHYNNDPIKPDYYPYDTRKYLVTNTCLVPVNEIYNLKPVLSNGMNFLDVCSLFEKHGIPESCHQEIIPKLGFEIIRVFGEKSIDFSKWFIVERPLSNIESFCRTFLK
jgi:hypothetical protein